jgi:fido (protein-threonine AMPylation protein)
MDTLQGPKLYSELVPQLALGVEHVMKQIVLRGRDDQGFSYGRILDLHKEAFKGVVAWAGRVRTKDVQVGNHFPPPYYQVRELLKQFADDLEYRVGKLDLEDLDQEEVMNIFALCEGRFTYIHPFTDFNGRISRLLSWMLVIRLGLPHTIEIVPPQGDGTFRQALFAALNAYDKHNREPLETIWGRRLLAAMRTQNEETEAAEAQLLREHLDNGHSG